MCTAKVKCCVNVGAAELMCVLGARLQQSGGIMQVRIAPLRRTDELTDKWFDVIVLVRIDVAASTAPGIAQVMPDEYQIS